MLQSLFFKHFKDDIGGRYPCAAPLVKTEQKEIFVASFLHGSAQMCLYQTPGSRQPHVTVL